MDYPLASQMLHFLIDNLCCMTLGIVKMKAQFSMSIIWFSRAMKLL
jgi:hypothetical protein